MCLRAVLGEQEFHRAQGYCVAGRRCGEPFSSLFTAAEGKGLLHCFLHPWWMLRKDRAAHPEQMCVVRSAVGRAGWDPEREDDGDASTWLLPALIRALLSLGFRDSISPQLLGWTGVAPFQCSLPGHIPLQPWLSAPAIPSTLALSFSGCFLMQTPPFTLASPKIPFPPLFLQPGR